jgi:hypothetical protein
MDDREKLLADLKELSDRRYGAAGFTPIFAIEQRILAEFDRLKLKVAELEGKLWDAQDEPQQPAGELVSDYELLRLTCDTTPEKLAKRAAEAQLAHTMRSLKAQGWVKLPSEDELADMLEQVFASNTGQPHSAWPLNKIAQELRRLLSL